MRDAAEDAAEAHVLSLLVTAAVTAGAFFGFRDGRLSGIQLITGGVLSASLWRSAFLLIEPIPLPGMALVALAAAHFAALVGALSEPGLQHTAAIVDYAAAAAYALPAVALALVLGLGRRWWLR